MLLVCLQKELYLVHLRLLGRGIRSIRHLLLLLQFQKYLHQMLDILRIQCRIIGVHDWLSVFGNWGLRQYLRLKRGGPRYL